VGREAVQGGGTSCEVGGDEGKFKSGQKGTEVERSGGRRNGGTGMGVGPCYCGYH
jgi:hypothetical protein